MSKIGEYNLGLQEQAEELGYDSVQEAIGGGCKIELTEGRLITPLEQEIAEAKDEQTKAHEAWLMEKQKVLDGLDYLLRGYEYTIEDAEKISNAIDFIEKGEI